MLGTDVVEEAERRGHAAVGLRGRAALDLSDFHAVQGALHHYQPEAVINCAAWTNVDGAETSPEGAWRDNALVPWHLASACAQQGAWLIQISTDFVFDGEKGSAYDEFDRVHPLSVYGRTKEAGERLVRQSLPARHMIARTAFLYGHHGDNLVEKILRAARSRPELTFVEDQVVSPTRTTDLARTLLDLVENPLPGTYHVTNAGQFSLLELARAVISLAGLSTPVHATTFAAFVAQYQPPARRPRYASLAHRMLALRGMDTLPQWQTALEMFLQSRKVRDE